MLGNYDLVSHGLLQREPDFVGSAEWWLWWREACGKKNPYAYGTREWKLWKQRVQTNPFRSGTPEWQRWRRGCCALEDSGAEGLLEREPVFVGTEEWWKWWSAACRKRNPYQPNTPNWKKWKTRVETNPFPPDSAAWRRWREGCCPPPPPVYFPWQAICAVLFLGAFVALAILAGLWFANHNRTTFVHPPLAPPSPPISPPPPGVPPTPSVPPSPSPPSPPSVPPPLAPLASRLCEPSQDAFADMNPDALVSH